MLYETDMLVIFPFILKLFLIKLARLMFFDGLVAPIGYDNIKNIWRWYSGISHWRKYMYNTYTYVIMGTG